MRRQRTSPKANRRLLKRTSTERRALWGRHRHPRIRVGLSWIFAYGSLVDLEDLRRVLGYDPVPETDWALASLGGYRRAWNVGMYNLHARKDDKFYVAENDQRFDGVVLSVGLERDSQVDVNGIVFRVESRTLPVLDRREKRYARTDVTGAIQTRARLGARSKVFTYLPLAEALAVANTGVEEGSAAISRDYYDRIEAAFDHLGTDEVAKYNNTTALPTAPVVDLRIVRPDTERHAQG